jgi:hypothetical protein
MSLNFFVLGVLDHKFEQLFPLDSSSLYLCSPLPCVSRGEQRCFLIDAYFFLRMCPRHMAERERERDDDFTHGPVPF